MRIIAEWKDNDQEIKRLWDKVYKTRSATTDEKSTQSHSGKVMCYLIIYPHICLHMYLSVWSHSDKVTYNLFICLYIHPSANLFIHPVTVVIILHRIYLHIYPVFI